jgi:hypothetical protein
MTAELAAAADPGFLERSADPAVFIVQACERAKTWLAEALEAGQIDKIAEVKSQAEAVRVYTTSRQLGQDAQLSAAEIVRRAERGLGLLVRKGQDEGTIRKRGENTGPRGDYTRAGRTVRAGPANGDSKVSPGTYIGEGAVGAATYAMTDGVGDADFEDALAAARSEKNLSRANVARKTTQRSTAGAAARGETIAEMAAQGYTSRQIASRLGIRDTAVRQIARDHGISIRADKVIGRTRKHNSNRIVAETSYALDGLATGIGLVTFSELDPAQIGGWAASLEQSLRALTRFTAKLKEIAS